MSHIVRQPVLETDWPAHESSLGLETMYIAKNKMSDKLDRMKSLVRAIAILETGLF